MTNPPQRVILTGDKRKQLETCGAIYRRILPERGGVSLPLCELKRPAGGAADYGAAPVATALEQNSLFAAVLRQRAGGMNIRLIEDVQDMDDTELQRVVRPFRNV